MRLPLKMSRKEHLARARVAKNIASENERLAEEWQPSNPEAAAEFQSVADEWREEAQAHCKAAKEATP